LDEKADFFMQFRNFSFGKINTHKRYDFQPRYYNERKEKLQSRIRKYEQEEDAHVHAERLESLKDRIADSWVRDDNYRKTIFQSNMRLLIVLGVILALAYFLFVGLDIGGSYIEQFKTLPPNE
jgi:hypothetical protein